MMTSPTWHFAVQAPDGLHGEVRRGPRHPEASGRLDGVEGLGELPGSNVDNQQQDRDPAHDDAGDGHPLVGGTPSCWWHTLRLPPACTGSPRSSQGHP